ncbi:MAG TPA: thioredoxin family protein [Tepidisphaeraceae bacterium]|nr:thioredoxin family protein [Tepidisphaeraceae bacterium]
MSESKATFRLAVFFGILAAWCIWWAHHPTNTVERIAWRDSFDAAHDEARHAGKPMLLYFTAAWCGPCQSLETTTWADPDVAAELSKYVSVKLDVDLPTTKPLATKYSVDAAGIPYFVLLDKDDKPIRSTVGAMPPDEFLSWMRGEKVADQ